MAERPVWRGHLRLALVSCPVALHSVLRASGNLRFHFINPKTGHRVRMVTLDAETDKEVSRRELVKGYEFEKDRYVLLDDEDFASAKIETSSTMTVDKFVARDAIHPIYFDTSYYVVPDGEAGEDVYVVLRDAIAKSGRAALSRVVIARRERAVAILPLENGHGAAHAARAARSLRLSETVRSGARCAAGCRDGEARDPTDRAAGGKIRAGRSGGSLRSPPARGDRRQAEGRRDHAGGAADPAGRQCDRPDGGVEAKPWSGWEAARARPEAVPAKRKASPSRKAKPPAKRVTGRKRA